MKTELYGTLACAATVFTGINLTVAKIGVQTIPSFIFVGMSFTIAGLILTAVSILRGEYSQMIILVRKSFTRIMRIAIVLGRLFRSF
jgi:hypothetical protein